MRPDAAVIFQYFKKKLNCFSNQFNLKQCFQQKNDSMNNLPATNNPATNNVETKEPKPNEPSICIPRVFKSTTRKDIYGVFEKLDLGAIDRIDMVAKTNERGECYNKVFIHFKVWNKKNPTVQATRDKLLKGEEVKIVYNEPWFWKCSASRVEKPEFRDYSAPPPRIDLGGCASLCAAKDATNEAVNEE
jgi:hypothetical protein